jgi:hypothetical protein
MSLKTRNRICPICDLKLEKNQNLVTMHYPVKYHRKGKTIITSNLTVHLDCKLSETGQKFLEVLK